MYDVVIVGFGPTGMLAAVQLGRAGLKVAAIERYRDIYGLARVGIVHDDVLRIFQELGLIEAVWPHTWFLPEFDLVRDGKILLSSPVSPKATHGWPEYISLFQPAFEAELERMAAAEPGVDIFRGETVVGLTQGPDSVTALAADESGRTRAIEGRWLIGADGGNSFVREALGVAYEDLGFDQDWLVVDGRMKRDLPHLPPMRQYCEPDQPGVALRIGPHLRRWSFMIFPEESREAVVEPEAVWRRLDRPDGATPEDVDLVRVAAYRFRSLYAERWRVGRAFLIGDAAHQMPPLLAQGLCTGLRDAYNLSAKLALVAKGLAGEDFLDTYEAERGPNTRDVILASMRMAGIVNERDPEKIAQRDAALLAMQAERAAGAEDKQLMAFRVPGLTGGFVAARAPGAGDAFPQAVVRRDGTEGRFDDLAGRGFLVLSRGEDPSTALSRDDLAFWRSLGGRFVRLAAVDAEPAPGEIEDAEGRYHGLLDVYGADILVKRADHHLFGAGRTPAELPALLAEMRAQLGA